MSHTCGDGIPDNGGKEGRVLGVIGKLTVDGEFGLPLFALPKFMSRFTRLGIELVCDPSRSDVDAVDPLLIVVGDERKVYS